MRRAAPGNPSRPGPPCAPGGLRRRDGHRRLPGKARPDPGHCVSRQLQHPPQVRVSHRAQSLPGGDEARARLFGQVPQRPHPVVRDAGAPKQRLGNAKDVLGRSFEGGRGLRIERIDAKPIAAPQASSGRTARKTRRRIGRRWGVDMGPPGAACVPAVVWRHRTVRDDDRRFSDVGQDAGSNPARPDPPSRPCGTSCGSPRATARALWPCLGFRA
jgi:hypothetical protein